MAFNLDEIHKEFCSISSVPENHNNTAARSEPTGLPPPVLTRTLRLRRF